MYNISILMGGGLRWGIFMNPLEWYNLQRMQALRGVRDMVKDLEDQDLKTLIVERAIENNIFDVLYAGVIRKQGGETYSVFGKTNMTYKAFDSDFAKACFRICVNEGEECAIPRLDEIGNYFDSFDIATSKFDVVLFKGRIYKDVPAAFIFYEGIDYDF